MPVGMALDMLGSPPNSTKSKHDSQPAGVPLPKSLVNTASPNPSCKLVARHRKSQLNKG
ncbi:hypothetical protein [Psychrobacter pygoscelis]|uniref:hypothetical protein n=1 Tax=Psychrobacter pygoscelis TaxID=2488563 RepID=UPI0013F4A679|nr:hypothetical protein [Psychrobacter pygoscelis]